MKIRVYYEDTDAGGIVYHTNYIKYCERARSEAFFAVGMMPSEDTKSGFIVKELNAQFLSTARLGDILEVETRVAKLRGSSTLLIQNIFRDSIKIFEMEILLVYVYGTKPTRIPPPHRSLLEEYLDYQDK